MRPRRWLAGEIGIGSVEEALGLVAQFYPNHLIQPKTQFALEEIFDTPAGSGRSEP